MTSDASCNHAAWVCLYRRVGDGAFKAHCQRCRAESSWRPDRADSERSIGEPTVGDVALIAAAAEIFTE